MFYFINIASKVIILIKYQNGDTQGGGEITII